MPASTMKSLELHLEMITLLCLFSLASICKGKESDRLLLHVFLGISFKGGFFSLEVHQTSKARDEIQETTDKTPSKERDRGWCPGSARMTRVPHTCFLSFSSLDRKRNVSTGSETNRAYLLMQRVMSIIFSRRAKRAAHLKLLSCLCRKDFPCKRLASSTPGHLFLPPDRRRCVWLESLPSHHSFSTKIMSPFAFLVNEEKHTRTFFSRMENESKEKGKRQKVIKQEAVLRRDWWCRGEEQDKHQKDVLFTAARLFSQQSLISKTKSFVFLYTHTFTREDASLFEWKSHVFAHDSQRNKWYDFV